MENVLRWGFKSGHDVLQIILSFEKRHLLHGKNHCPVLLQSMYMCTKAEMGDDKDLECFVLKLCNREV